MGGSECAVCGWPQVFRTTPSGLTLRDVEHDDRHRYFFTAAIVVAALVNYYVPLYIFQVAGSPVKPLDAFIYLGAFLCGVVAGQVGLLAVWAALGSQAFALRLFRSSLVFFVLAGSFVLGAALVTPPRERQFLLTMFMMSPLVFAAAQAPLWLTRLLPQRRQTGAGGAAAGSAGHQFRLRDLFTAMGAVAIALTIARIGIAVGSPAATAVANSTLWRLMMVVCAAAAALCAVSTAPSVRAVFWARNTLAACLTLAICVLGATVAVGVVIGVVFQVPILVALYIPVSAVAGLFAVQIGLLLAAKAFGIRVFGARAGAEPTLR